MDKVFKGLMSLFLVSSLFACSSNVSDKQSDNATAETSVATEEAKEPELKEIEITLDNWEDYFDLYTKLNSEKAEGSDFLEEDYGKEYHGTYGLYLKIKDEYKEKIARDRNNAILIAADLEIIRVRASIVNGDLVLEDELIQNDNPEWASHGYAVVPKEDIKNNEVLHLAGLRIDEDGLIYQVKQLEKEALYTDEIIDGAQIKVLSIFHDLVKDEKGKSYRIVSDDAVFAAKKERKIEWKEFQGTIYILE